MAVNLPQPRRGESYKTLSKQLNELQIFHNLLSQTQPKFHNKLASSINKSIINQSNFSIN